MRDIDGQTDRSNGAYGESDIEGKTAREAASELGKERVSNERKHMSQCGLRASFNRRRPQTGTNFSAALTIDRFIAENGKGPYPDME